MENVQFVCTWNNNRANKIIEREAVKRSAFNWESRTARYTVYHCSYILFLFTARSFYKSLRSHTTFLRRASRFLTIKSAFRSFVLFQHFITTRGWIIIAAAGEEEPDEKTTVSRISRAIRFRSWMRLMLYLAMLPTRERRYGWSGHDRETLSRWWPFAMPLVGSPWLGESVRCRLGPSDLVFHASQCLPTYVRLELDTVSFVYLGRPEWCKTKLRLAESTSQMWAISSEMNSFELTFLRRSTEQTNESDIQVRCGETVRYLKARDFADWERCWSEATRETRTFTCCCKTPFRRGTKICNDH